MKFDIHPEIIQFPNGLRLVYLYKDSYVGHFGINILAGSRYERENEQGLAHFIEHCIFKGTHKRKAFHILSRLDAVGGELNAYTAKEEIAIYASFTNQHLQRAIELVADIAFHSSFPEKEILKEKEVVLDELNSYLDSPGERIFDDFEAHLFKGHALGYNILGNEQSIRNFTKEDLQHYVNRFFSLKNMVVSYVGSESIEKIKKLVEKYFSNENQNPVKVKLSSFKPQPAFKLKEEHGNVQTHAIIGGLAPNYTANDRRGMTLLTNILGGPALNSRLTLSIREKHGYAYNVEANYTPYMDTGFWSIYLGTDEKYLQKSLKLVQKELKNLCEIKMGVHQLNQAKEQLKGQIALSLEGNGGLMLGLGKSVLLFNQIDTISAIYKEIDGITATDLLEVANKYFAPTNQSELIFEVKK
ncbi:MAG: insulinase family protein [Crocinitomicaceae bacterium]|nr:insulinase family protein [Crocinitomicaceae bacterium]